MASSFRCGEDREARQRHACTALPAAHQRMVQKNFFSRKGFSEAGTGTIRGSSRMCASQYAIRSAAALDTWNIQKKIFDQTFQIYSLNCVMMFQGHFLGCYQKHAVLHFRFSINVHVVKVASSVLLLKFSSHGFKVQTHPGAIAASHFWSLHFSCLKSSIKDPQKNSE